jgi:DNA-binding winged helix-turn-helix (wHTH) protein
LAQVMNGLHGDWKDHIEQTVIHAPQSLAECLKVWTQLTEEEQHELTTLVTEPGASLPQPRINRLEQLGLVQEGKPFAPVFSDFISRWGRSPEIDATGIHVDTDSGDVWVGGVRIPVLTDLEYRLLKLLYERLDKITDKYGIVEGVWGETYLGEVDDARVEKLVSRLRGKIEPDPTDPIYLITQRGRGYKLLTRPRGG